MKKGLRMGFVLIAALLLWGMSARVRSQDSIPLQRWFTLRVDDDFLNVAGQGTDRYYSGGIYLRYSFVVPGGKKNRVVSSYSIGATQLVYTPNDLGSKTAVKGDYPYCGALFLQLSRETVSSGQTKLFRSELWLGVMGPAALARQVQLGVHSFVKTTNPEGWANQIPNYPVVNYNLFFEPNLFSLSRILKVNGVAAVQAGTFADNLSLGLDLAISNVLGDFFPGRAYITGDHGKKRAKFYAQAIPAARFVGYSSFLQGGAFDRRDFYHIPAEDLHRVVFQEPGYWGCNWGIVRSSTGR